MKVSEILEVKGAGLYTVTPDESLLDAVNVMAERDIGSVAVLELGELVGMLTFPRSDQGHPGNRERWARHGAQAHERPADHDHARYRSQ